MSTLNDFVGKEVIFNGCNGPSKGIVYQAEYGSFFFLGIDKKYQGGAPYNGKQGYKGSRGLSSGDVSNLSLINKIKTMKKEINGYECEYFTQDDEFVITYNNWKYKANFFGEIESFIERNKNVISSFFDNKVDEKITDILLDFKRAFSILKKGLKDLYIPQTKDLLIAKTMEMIKDQAVELASLFEDKGIKTSIMSLFTNKK